MCELGYLSLPLLTLGLTSDYWLLTLRMWCYDNCHSHLFKTKKHFKKF